MFGFGGGWVFLISFLIINVQLVADGRIIL